MSGRRLVSRVTPACKGQAVRAALRTLPDEGHYGYVHPTPGPFVYRPDECPGCLRSVLEALVPEVEGSA